MYRSASLPNLNLNNVEEGEDDPQSYIYNLQLQLDKSITLNTVQAEAIRILQNQLTERTSYLEILTKQPLPPVKRRTSKSPATYQKQLFYKQNKHNPDVIKKVRDLYGKPFLDAGIPIPWQLVRTVTDKLFMDQVPTPTAE